MLIPSIDLMGGKIVQLVQGEKKALEFDNFSYWIERFSKYPLVQVIDLDAARGAGNNRLLVNQIVRRLNCQVGGGIRSLATARELLEAGARRVILGSALLQNNQINTQYAASLESALGSAALVFALDSRGGRVATDGMAQREYSHPFRHDPRPGALLRHFSLHAHRHGRPDGRNSNANRECHTAGHFAAACGRRRYHDAARNRPTRRVADGRCCWHGLVFRQNFAVAEIQSTEAPG